MNRLNASVPTSVAFSSSVRRQLAGQRLLQHRTRQLHVVVGRVFGNEEITRPEGPENRTPVAARAALVGSLVAHPVHLVRHGADYPLDQIVGGHDLVTLGIDELALFVEDVVEFQQVLASFEVPLLDPALGAFQGLVDPRMGQRLAVGEPHLGNHAAHVLSEQPHQVVVQGDVEA